MQDDRDATLAFATRLPHRFSDPSLLELALTHRSWSHDRVPIEPDNERLEFLGDAVLGFVVADRLFAHGVGSEAELTRARAEIVKRQTLAEAARRLDLGPVLRLGRSADGTARDSDRILACGYEAVVGAVYSDGGLEAAKAFLDATLGDQLARSAGGDLHAPEDPATRLQQHTQASHAMTPRYRFDPLGELDHEKTWRAQVLLPDGASFTAEGRSKAEARRLVAQLALDAIAQAAHATEAAS